MLRIESWPLGPRLFLGPFRIEHWHFGALFVVAGVRLIWRDRADLPGIR